MSEESATADLKTEKKQGSIIRTLNIDPALSKCGWSILDLKKGSGGKNATVSVVRWGNISASAVAGRVANAEFCKRYSKRIISLRELRAGIREIMIEFKPDYITIEDTFFHTSFPTAYAALEQCITTIALLLHDEFQQPLYRIPTKSAKKSISDSGSSKKINVLTAIRDSKVITFRQKKKAAELDHHSADSIAVGYHFLSKIWPDIERGQEVKLCR